MDRGESASSTVPYCFSYYYLHHSQLRDVQYFSDVRGGCGVYGW